MELPSGASQNKIEYQQTNALPPDGQYPSSVRGYYPNQKVNSKYPINIPRPTQLDDTVDIESSKPRPLSTAAMAASSTQMIAPSDYEHIYHNPTLLAPGVRSNADGTVVETVQLADFVVAAVTEFIQRQEDKYQR